MITREQIRGALAMLGWSLRTLQEGMDVRVSVNALSTFLKPGSATSMGYDRVASIERALTEAGAEFGEGNWVRLTKQTGALSKSPVKK